MPSTHLPTALLTFATITLVSTPQLSAQSIETRITAVGTGTVHLSYAAREGVCGNGRNISTHDRSDEREFDCEAGPVRVSISVDDGVVTRARTYVGGRWRTTGDRVTDLGSVSAPAAARGLIDLAERGDAGGDDLVFAASIADSVVIWPDLLRIARRATLPSKTRTSAVFWISQSAGDAATRGLADLAGDEAQDRDVREHAVFGLSQLPDNQGVPILLQVARSNRDPQIRRKAIFWLGQSEDARALAFFEEVLLGKS